MWRENVTKTLITCMLYRISDLLEFSSLPTYRPLSMETELPDK